MKKILRSLSLLTILINTTITAQTTWVTTSCAGSPTVTQVVINACGTSEGLTEFFNFETGTSSFDINTLSLTGSSIYMGATAPISGTTPAGNPISNGFTSQSPAATAVITYLNSLTGGCAPTVFIPVPASGIVPAGKKVMVFPSSGPINSIGTPSLAAYCGQEIYVIVGSYVPNGGTAGFYTNSGAGATNPNPTLTITMGGCTYTISYTLPVNGDGGNITNAGGGLGTINAGTGDCFPAPPLNCTIPTATASNTISPTVLCVGATNQTINLSVATNASPATYAWSGPNLPAGIANQQNPTITNAALPIGTHTYTVTVTGTGGCTKTSTTSVQVRATPSGTPSQSGMICGNGSPYSGTVTLAATGGTNYTWSSGQTGFVTSVPVTQPGSYGVTVTNTAGCSVEKTYTVTATPAPNPVITAPATLCPTETATLSLNTTYSTYAWSGGGSSATKPITGSGIYTVTVTNAAGCTGVGSVTITATTALTPTINAPASLCTGGNGVLTLSSGYNSYLWSAGSLTGTQAITGPGTYSVTVTNSSGCSGSTTITVPTATPPTPTINAPPTLCAGAVTSLTLNGGPYANQTWSGGTTPNLAITNITGPGNYSVTVTNAAGCTGTASVIIGPGASLSPTIAPHGKICGSGSINLSVSGVYSNYLWSGGSSVATQNVTAAGTYTVTITDAAGCTGVASTTVQQVTSPTVNITGTLSICQGASTTLTAVSPNTISNYAWTPSGSINMITVTTAGNYSVTVTDNEGCTATSFVAVGNFPNPTATTSGDMVVCFGAQTSVSVNGANLTSYIWSGGQNGQLVNLGKGTHTVTVTDNNGCKGTATHTITEDIPSTNITGNLNICQGATTTLAYTGAFVLTSWSNGSSTNSITVGAGTHSVTVTNSNGCQAKATVTVTAIPQPTVTITGNTSFCIGSTNVLATNPTFSSYVWSNQTTGASISPPATGTYFVTVTDANGCTATASKNVTQYANPTPNISGSTTICAGSSTTLGVGNYNSYIWSNGSTNQTTLVNQQGTIGVTVTDINGCKGTDSKNITSSAALVFPITGIPSFCEGKTTTLSAGAGFDTYLWDNGATTVSIIASIEKTYTVTVTSGICSGTASIVVTKKSTPTFAFTGNIPFCQGASIVLGTNPTFSAYSWSGGGLNSTLTVTQSGSYTVTVTDSNGCIGQQSLVAVVNQNPIPAISGSTSLCVGDSTKLSLTQSFSSYIWSNGKSTSSIFANAIQNYSVTVTDINGCKGIATIAVNKATDLKPFLSGKKTFCEGESVELSVAAGFGKYKWSSGEETEKITVTKGGTYVVTVSNGACKGVDSALVQMNLKPVIDLTKDTAVCEGTNVSLTANVNALSYKWSHNAFGETVIVSKSGTYVVTVTTAEGCVSRDSVKVTVNPLPKPVVFAPSTICVGEEAVLALTEKYAAYLWSVDNKTSDTIKVKIPDTYTVTVTTAAGCTGTANHKIEVKNNLSPKILGTAKFCTGSTTTLSLDANYATYKWSDSSNASTLIVGVEGTYIVTVSSAAGCTGIASVTVVKSTLPSVPSIKGSLFVCGANATTLDAGAGYKSYLWLNKDTTQITKVTKAGFYSVTVTNTDDCVGSTGVLVEEVNPKGTLKDTLCKGGSRVINGKKYDETNTSGVETLLKAATGGCDSILTVQLYFRPEISVNLSGSNTVCSNQNTDLILLVQGYNGIFDLVYEDDLGVKTPVNGIKNGEKITLNPSKTTTYTIISTTIPNGNCGVTLGSAKITIGALTHTAKVTDISCNGQKDGSVIVSPTSGTSPYSFEWSNGVKVADNVNVAAGKYTVTISDAGGCSAVKTYDIIEPAVIQGEIIGEGVSCKGNAGQIIIKNITGGSGNYSYSLDGKIFNAIGSLPFTLPNIAAGDYTVIINDGNKCTWSQKLNIAASATRKVDLGLDITLNYGDSVVITPKVDYQLKKIVWTPKAYMTCNDSTCQFPSVKPKATTTYRVVVTDENGCTATDDVAIFVNKVRRVYIPSAFSPGNSDGYNDLLRVYLGDETVKVKLFRVFDRWGNMVYEDIDFSKAESQNIDRGWNGVFRGDALDPAVFTYHVQVEFTDGEVKDYKGDVMLIRN